MSDFTMTENESLDMLNDILNGKGMDTLVPKPSQTTTEAEATAPADEVVEQVTAEAPEAETPVQQVDQESDSDKEYNFRRLREQTQEYKAKLSELEDFKAQASAALNQLYVQNQQLQQSISQPKPAPAVVAEERELTDVEKEIRKQIREMSAGEIKRLEELRGAEEARIQAIRGKELLTSATSTVDEIISLGKVDLGPQKDRFKSFVTELVLNAADKYNVAPDQTRDAVLNMLEMYHLAKRSQEKSVTKAVVDQGKRVSTPITKVSVAPADSMVAAKIPPMTDLRKQGYKGDNIEVLFQWQRDQMSKQKR